MNAIALRALADLADALARLTREVAVEQDVSDPTRQIPIADAAKLAATSKRVVRDAIRDGSLPAFGKQRDRSVRRGDLDAWVESRRVRPIMGPDDADIERRMRRIARRTAPKRREKRRAPAS